MRVTEQFIMEGYGRKPEAFGSFIMWKSLWDAAIWGFSLEFETFGICQTKDVIPITAMMTRHHNDVLVPNQEKHY
jgi:hypothetical protein